MTTEQLYNQIQLKKSFSCVGLDVDLNKIPKHQEALELHF
jgi:orotidine-5'-phosphate decarboxylase